MNKVFLILFLLISFLFTEKIEFVFVIYKDYETEKINMPISNQNKITIDYEIAKSNNDDFDSRENIKKNKNYNDADFKNNKYLIDYPFNEKLADDSNEISIDFTATIRNTFK